MERHRLHISGATHPKASDYNCLFHKKIREYGIDNIELIVLEEIILKIHPFKILLFIYIIKFAKFIYITN